MDTRQEQAERLRVRIDCCKHQADMDMRVAYQALVVNDFAAVLTALEAAVYATKKAEAWWGERVRVRKAAADAEVKKGDEQI